MVHPLLYSFCAEIYGATFRRQTFLSSPRTFFRLPIRITKLVLLLCESTKRKTKSIRFPKREADKRNNGKPTSKVSFRFRDFLELLILRFRRTRGIFQPRRLQIKR